MYKAEKPKIMVVNDDPASLLALAGILSHSTDELPYDVISAASGQAALRQVLQHDFAVIFLDVNMPAMSGYEAAAAIRQRHHSASTPIIFVTAYQADELDKSRAYDCGAADFLFTPVIPQILQAKARIFVALAAKNAEVKWQTAKLEAKTAELDEANQRLQREMKERQLAETESDAKDEFLAMLGHELRNPLSAIRTAGALMSMPGVTALAAAKAKQVIERQSRHLALMVDELMDLSRALSAKITLDKQSLELSEIVSRCLEDPLLCDRIDQRTLRTDVGKAPVYGDRARIGQIVTQLIENAFKYSGPGDLVELSTVVEHDVAKFIVRDHGMGIPPELLPRLFNVFVQGSTSIDRTQGGLGIGLALAHKLTELHGGKLVAQSDGAGRGSTFTLSLPIRRPLHAAYRG